MDKRNTDYDSREEELFRESMEAEERRRAAAVKADMTENGQNEADAADGPEDEYGTSEAGEDYSTDAMGEDRGAEDPETDLDAASKERAAAEEELRAAKRARREAQIERDRARHERRMAEKDLRAAREMGADAARESSAAGRRSASGNGKRLSPEERSEYEEDYQEYREKRKAEDQAAKERQKSARNRERAVRKKYDDDGDQYRKEYYGDRYESEGREKRWRKQEKKAGPVKKFLRALLIVLLIGILLIGILYLRIRGGGSDFLSRVKEAISGATQENSSMDGYTNIALFGVDSITESLSAGNNRSDVNMILSINDRTKECKLVSVYRDTYLDIGSATYTKCNAAYAYGGPAQAVSMLNQNFDLDIEDYVTIGFGGIADIIDAVGGVEIDVQQDEISFMNDYQSTMAAELGKTYIPVTAAGTQTLTGLQATAYCRIRYTDGGDYHRTERQREVLTQTFRKLKASNAATDAEIMMKLIGNNELETSLSPTEIMSLASGLSGYEVSDTAGVPTEDLRVEAYVGDQACIIPYTLKQNVVWLHQYLFGETDYQVSDTVQAISNQIEQNTGY